MKVIATWKNPQIIPNIEYPYNKKHLVFKLLLNNNDNKNKTIENYATINLYENRYTLISFNMNNYLTVKEIKEKLQEVSDFLLKIIIQLLEPF